MWNKVVSKKRIGAFALFLSLSGCTALSDCKYELGQKLRTQQAWHEFDSCHNRCFTCDYSTGWKAGFYDVATGGEGCPPVIAPKRYWKPPVFVEYDPSRRDDWYTGFQDGAAYAESQTDHHYLKTFLPPRVCCPVHAASYPQVIEQPGSSPMEQILEHPEFGEPVIDAAPAAEGTVPVETAPMPPMPPEPQQPTTEPVPAGTDDYEKDPAPESPQAAASLNSTLQQRLVKQYQEQLQQQAGSSRTSLLEQLVLNAAQPAEDCSF